MSVVRVMRAGVVITGSGTPCAEFDASFRGVRADGDVRARGHVRAARGVEAEEPGGAGGAHGAAGRHLPPVRRCAAGCFGEPSWCV